MHKGKLTNGGALGPTIVLRLAAVGELRLCHNLLQPYRVDEALMKRTAPGAIFMHCLPAHRGEEVTAEVIDGPQSVVFDEAENRLHAQKGVLAWVLGSARRDSGKRSPRSCGSASFPETGPLCATPPPVSRLTAECEY